MQITYTDIDHEQTPFGRMQLRKYIAETGEEGYEILLNGGFLMASHGAHSEQAMASLAFERYAPNTDILRILIGGLGAGHTLRAALDLPCHQKEIKILVAEISNKVLLWNKLYFSKINKNAVKDDRVTVKIDDLKNILTRSPNSFELILLDVDNGPGDLVAKENQRLFEPEGIRLCYKALTPGGVLAVWSPHRNKDFFRDFLLSFPDGEEFDTTQIGKKVEEQGDIIYLGSRQIASY